MWSSGGKRKSTSSNKQAGHVQTLYGEGRRNIACRKASKNYLNVYTPLKTHGTLSKKLLLPTHTPTTPPAHPQTETPCSITLNPKEMAWHGHGSMAGQLDGLDGSGVGLAWEGGCTPKTHTWRRRQEWVTCSQEKRRRKNSPNKRKQQPLSQAFSFYGEAKGA